MADVNVSVHSVVPRKLVAVRRQALIEEIATAWRPALDKVWQVVRSYPGLWTNGRTVFLYHHGADRSLPMTIDFGVEVLRAFKTVGEVFGTETPAGEVAHTVHVGRYQRLAETHTAIQQWCDAHGRTIAGVSWETYGLWTDDESKLETTVEYLLTQR
jgi:hypothetical protein